MRDVWAAVRPGLGAQRPAIGGGGGRGPARGPASRRPVGGDRAQHLPARGPACSTTWSRRSPSGGRGGGGAGLLRPPGVAGRPARDGDDRGARRGQRSRGASADREPGAAVEDHLGPHPAGHRRGAARQPEHRRASSPSSSRWRSRRSATTSRSCATRASWPTPPGAGGASWSSSTACSTSSSTTWRGCWTPRANRAHHARRRSPPRSASDRDRAPGRPPAPSTDPATASGGPIGKVP